MKELMKDKPRKDVILPLVKDTFTYRCNFIMYDAKSVAEVLEKCPALKLTYAVSSSMTF